MKYFFFCIAFFSTSGLFAQISDSLAVDQEIRSIIKSSYTLMDQWKINEALELVKQAEEKALSTFGRNSAVYATCLHDHALDL